MSERNKNWQGMNWIRQEKRLAIYIRVDFTCQCCGLDMRANLPEGRRIELDHIVPHSKGGSNSQTNLVTVCGGVGGCNQRRQDRDISEFCPANHKDILIQALKPINVPLAKQVLCERKTSREV